MVFYARPRLRRWRVVVCHAADTASWQRDFFFAMVDHLLDRKSPVNHLSDSKQAKIVRDAFYHFAEERYELLAFVIMPSHHHWLFLPDENWAVREIAENREAGKKLQTAREIISHSVQSYTATMCNRARAFLANIGSMKRSIIGLVTKKRRFALRATLSKTQCGSGW